MAISFPANPANGATYTNPTTGVQYIYNTADGVWKTYVWPTNTNYLQLTGGTLTGDLELGTNDLTAQDITATGGLTVGNGLTLSDGNIAMAAGHGIDFSADANTAGMTSELLDDYEEGTWTPTILGCTVTALGASNSRYIKVGKIVTCIIDLQNITWNTGGSQLQLSGLPFTAGSTRTMTGNIAWYYLIANLATNATVAGYIVNGGNTITYYQSRSNSTWTLCSTPATGSNGYLAGFFTYHSA